MPWPGQKKQPPMRCSLCKGQVLVVEVTTPRGRVFPATFCPRCDNTSKGEKRDPRS